MLSHRGVTDSTTAAKVRITLTGASAGTLRRSLASFSSIHLATSASDMLAERAAILSPSQGVRGQPLKIQNAQNERACKLCDDIARPCSEDYVPDAQQLQQATMACALVYAAARTSLRMPGTRGPRCVVAAAAHIRGRVPNGVGTEVRQHRTTRRSVQQRVRFANRLRDYKRTC
jgi:hypothetical protein